MSAQLPHADHVEQLLDDARNADAAGNLDAAHALRREAQRLHNAHVAAELERASREPINLSDLMAGREAFTIDDIERDAPASERRRGGTQGSFEDA